jgi:hypothetical protein
MLKEKIRIVICILTLINTPLFVHGQERKALKTDFESELRTVQNELWINPALIDHQYKWEFTDASLTYKTRESLGLYTIEEGNKNTSIDFDAYSFKNILKSSLYGRATYNNSTTENINWNTVSDHILLAPYIVADSIGGKSFKENYAFEGIYKRSIKESSFAIQFKYKSSESYRKLDPRPKSTVSDLNIIIGGATPIFANYKFGLSLNYRDYQQNNGVEAMRPGTGIKLFYLRGFGISDENFSTVITDRQSNSNTYDIKGYSIAAQLMPDASSGFFHSLSYSTNRVELQTTHQLDIVSHLENKKADLVIGKSYQSIKREIKIKAFVSYTDKKGFEYNYNHDRKLLSSGQKYSSNLLNAGINSVWLNHGKKNKALYNIELAYTKDESDYKTSSLQQPKQVIEYLRIKALGGKSLGFTKTGLNFKLSGIYLYTINNELVLSKLTEERVNNTLVLPNYNYLKNDKLIIDSDIRYDIDYGLYGRLNCQYIFIKSSKPQYSLALSIGLTL